MTPREALAEMFDLTKKQTAVLWFILNYRWQHGYSPSIRNIAEHFDVNIFAVVGRLKLLRDKGAIAKSTKYLNRVLVPRVQFIPAERL